MKKCCKNCTHCKKEKGLSGPKYICELKSRTGVCKYALDGSFILKDKKHKEYVKPTSCCHCYLPSLQ